jgi:glucan phosphoethanolaminetransferase (alkaline phosphatase superfamily)
MKMFLHYALIVFGVLYFLASYLTILEYNHVGVYSIWQTGLILIPNITVTMFCLLAANFIRPLPFIAGNMSRNILISFGFIMMIMLCFDLYSTWVQEELGLLLHELPNKGEYNMTTLSLPRYLADVFWVFTHTIACFFAAHTIKPFGDKND